MEFLKSAWGYISGSTIRKLRKELKFEKQSYERLLKDLMRMKLSRHRENQGYVNCHTQLIEATDAYIRDVLEPCIDEELDEVICGDTDNF